MGILTAIVIATVFMASTSASGPPTGTTVKPFRVKSVTFTGDMTRTQLNYIQTAIVGEFVKNGMLIDSEGVEITATATWLDGETGRDRALQLTSQALREKQVSWSIAVTGGGATGLASGIPRRNFDEYIIDDATAKFAEKLKTQITAQQMAINSTTTGTTATKMEKITVPAASPTTPKTKR
ncbi:MAG: hypothetical protein UX31_C0011G0012 [Candidatus Nomurabacteria bacterium GW2011_GWA1_46_11]|uniref:Uncharacterized protein n=2 Tax=Parcubacteria group TaxID=1794811 RepID=A0A1F8EYL3_9BACT|nr:MAG: hypothetical protein UX31_C0011G0012 [Candidatus Nomurabacteria bacterium GW2011_GWA1_46_11]OGN05951.1 MAG: hypothetical protein A2669_01115 [Candidatus Yanofskybacteria bacterium RIFCSPHIGHO2_01_FULL_48_25b]